MGHILVRKIRVVPKSQVPIWNAANPSGNLFKTLSTFSCPFWTLRSVDARHEFWSLKSKFESQSLGLKLGIPWDTQTECLKKSLGRCLCVVIAWQNIAKAAIGCLQNTCRAFALARVNRATKEKVNLKLNETLVIDVEKYNNGLKFEATIVFWNTFPNLPQPWFCHNPTNHIISSIYQLPFRKHVGAPASGSAPSLPWRVAAPVLLLILPQLDLHFPISAGLVSLQVFRASWLAT